MSREKQIDEIAKYICKNYSPYCSMCPDCYAQEEATALYNAGYRKQSEEEAECPTCHGTGRIYTTNCLIKNIYKKQLAEEKAKEITVY